MVDSFIDWLIETHPFLTRPLPEMYIQVDTQSLQPLYDSSPSIYRMQMLFTIRSFIHNKLVQQYKRSQKLADSRQKRDMTITWPGVIRLAPISNNGRLTYIKDDQITGVAEYCAAELSK